MFWSHLGYCIHNLHSDCTAALSPSFNEVHLFNFIGTTVPEIKVQNGKKTSISMIQQSFQRISTKSNPCSQDQSETFLHCTTSCQIKYLEDQCNCFFATYYSENTDENFLPCPFSKAFEETCYQAGKTIKTPEFIESCNCFLPCSEKSYKFEYTVGDVGLRPILKNF